MEPGILKRRASQTDDGPVLNAENFMSTISTSGNQLGSAEKKDRSLIPAGKKRGPVRRKSNPGVPSRGRGSGRRTQRRSSNVNTKRLKRQSSVSKSLGMFIKSDEAPSRLVNPLIEWPPAANDPYIDPNKRQRLSVATPAPSVSIPETHTSADADLEGFPLKANGDTDVANVKRCGRVADMVQMLDLERPDTFPLAWQAQLLGLSLPEVIRVDDDLLQQVRDANPIKDVQVEEVVPAKTFFQWSWANDEDDEKKLLSERDPTYVSLLDITSQEEKMFRPISPTQFNRLHQSVVFDTAPILSLARECGLWTPGHFSFSLMEPASRCFGWEMLSCTSLLGFIKTQVEWYSAPGLQRNELVSRWQSFRYGTHQWLDPAFELDDRKRKEAEQPFRAVDLACLETNLEGSAGKEANKSSTKNTAVTAERMNKRASSDVQFDDNEASTERSMILLFSLALEHARACGITYISIENMSFEWKSLLTTYFRMTVKQEMVESKNVSLVCDLMKISYRYAFLLFQSRAKQIIDSIPKESGVSMNAASAKEGTSRVRWVASIAPAVMSSEDDCARVLGVQKRARTRLAVFRAELSPSINFMDLTEDGESGDKIESVSEKVDSTFSLVRAFPRPIEQPFSASEVCAAINLMQKELASLESSLQPKIHDLIVCSIKERIEFEKLRDKREHENNILDESVKLIERRREQDLAFKRQQEQDMEAVCEICGDGEVTPDNQMVFCEFCDVAVHQICYGIEKVPEGDYYCYACTRLQTLNVPHSNEEQSTAQMLRTSCELCPLKRGAFIETDVKSEAGSAPFGKWIHVVCAKWQGLRFERSPDLIEDVTDLKIRFRQHGITCFLCRGERGAMNKCRHEGCTTWIHVTCARAVGSCEVIHGENAFGDIETNPWTLLCPKHSQIPIKNIPEGCMTSEELVLLASEFPPDPPPPPAEVIPRPFNTIGGEERERLLQNEEYERSLLIELTTKRLFGYRCEVCDTMEDDGKNILRCPSCCSICCLSCKFDSDVSDGVYKCQSCRFIEESAKIDENTKIPACLVCCQKGGVLRRGFAKSVGRKSYWKNYPNEFEKSFFGQPIWVHSVCGFWIPKVEVSYSGVVNCSDVVMANGKGLILAQSRCFLCGQSAGLKIRCDDDCCSRQKSSEHQYFHVTCARQAGLEVNVSGDDDLTFYLKCYRHGGNEFNLRAKIEDLLEIEKRRSGKTLAKYHMPMSFPHAQRLLNSAIQVMRTLGWAWRWAEWWVDYDSSWEPLLEPGQIESEMTKEELKIVESTRASRCEDARRCRLEAFSVALRERLYDSENGFDRLSLDRAIRSLLATKSLVGPLESFEQDFLTEWLGRAYRSKSKLLGFGEEKIEAHHGVWCLHKKDNSPKFLLVGRLVPGREEFGEECFPEAVEEVDDFMMTELEPSDGDGESKRAPPKRSRSGPRRPENKQKRSPGRSRRAANDKVNDRFRLEAKQDSSNRSPNIPGRTENRLKSDTAGQEATQATPKRSPGRPPRRMKQHETPLVLPQVIDDKITSKPRRGRPRRLPVPEVARDDGKACSDVHSSTVAVVTGRTRSSCQNAGDLGPEHKSPNPDQAPSSSKKKSKGRGRPRRSVDTHESLPNS